MPTVPLLAEEELPIPPGAARILGDGARVRQAYPSGARARIGRPARRLARLGRAGGGQGVRGGRGARPLGAPGGRGRPRRRGPERDHFDRPGLRQVARLPAARADRGPERRHRAVPVADPGAGRRPAADDLLARHPGRARGRGRRRHPVLGAELGPRPRQLPAHHPGHAASFAAAAARALGRFLPPPVLRDRGRMPHLSRGFRLACGPGPATAPARERASHIGHYAPSRPDLFPLLGDDQRARDLRPAADRPRRGGGHRPTAPPAAR